MTQYALIKNGIVENVIEWDGATKYKAPTGYQIKPLTCGGIGWSCVNDEFIAPVIEEEIIIEQGV